MERATPPPMSPRVNRSVPLPEDVGFYEALADARLASTASHNG